MLDSILDIFAGRTETDRQIEELQAMDDHDLADLGIARDQIDAFVAAHSDETV
jgi:uncharacterized protein YjiS (DUF1127 family)